MSWRQRFFKRWLALLPIAVILLLYPINNLPIRLGIIVSLSGLIGGLLYFYWSNRGIRLTVFICMAAAISFILLPGRSPDIAKLRLEYLASLNRYEGTRYVWGGENRLGVDCSGLLRSGLIAANYREGFLNLNSQLVRTGLSMWWHDCSAKALGEQYRQQTRLLFAAPSVNEIDTAKILPGDIIVTATGVHTMAYLGEQTWIEAEPIQGRVIKVKVPNKAPWFDEPVNILRWTELDESTARRE